MKKLNIFSRLPITNLAVPLRGDIKGIRLEDDDIRRCIISGARVTEVLDNGELVHLTLDNYNKNNNKHDSVSSADIGAVVPEVQAENFVQIVAEDKVETIEDPVVEDVAETAKVEDATAATTEEVETEIEDHSETNNTTTTVNHKKKKKR